MSRTLTCLLLLGIVVPGLVPAVAQAAPSAAADHSAAVAKAADQFIQRLHQTLDFSTLGDMLVKDEAARHREYPGDFVLFPTPRMSKALLNQTDDAAIRRKLDADRTLFYLTFVFLKANPEQLAGAEQKLKALPPDFVKTARKSKYLRNFGGIPGHITLISAAELSEYMGEAQALTAILRKNLKAEMLAAPVFVEAAARMQGNGNLTRLIDRMGYDVVYALPRESLLLVFAEVDGGFKLATIAPND